MTSGDTTLPKHLTYSKSKVPIIGALIDYMDTSFEYLRRKTFAQAEKLHAKATRATLSATFMATICLMLGIASNMKFEVVTFDEEPLINDLHFMLLSTENNLYIDDIDVSRNSNLTSLTDNELTHRFICAAHFRPDSIHQGEKRWRLLGPAVPIHYQLTESDGPSHLETRVMWCLEASDMVVVLISCLLIWSSSNVRSPQSEYLFLPWLGATLRGLFLRQGPTAGALLYTMAVVNGNVNPLFLTAFSFLFLLEARLWLEIARLVCARWERRDHSGQRAAPYEVETLWSNEDVQSIEVRNYVY